MKMKKALLLLFAVLLILSACEKENHLSDYWNLDGSCMLNGTFYQSAGNQILVWNSRWDGIRNGLCHDPLCNHDDINNLCPDNNWLWQKAIVTDGEKLYLSVLNAALTGADNTLYRQIYALSPDGTDLQLLCTYDASGGTSPVLRYSDGYLYFWQGFYREPDDFGNSEDQYKIVMRLPVQGKKAEIVLDEEMPMHSTFCIDKQNYYLFFSDENGTAQLIVIDQDSGKRETYASDEFEGIPYTMRIYNGKTYLLASKPETVSAIRDDGSQAIRNLNCSVLYLYENNSFRKIADGNFTFTQEGIWFPESECDYLGTKETAGGPYGETTKQDYVAVTTKRLCKIDPTDYGITAYMTAGEFGYGDEIELVSGTAGKLYANISNQKSFYEIGDSQYRSCMLRAENGTVVMEKVYE